jgi:hypothetical protein
MGIEPTSAAWEAAILPLNHARSSLTYQTRLDPSKPVITGISAIHRTTASFVDGS